MATIESITPSRLFLLGARRPRPPLPLVAVVAAVAVLAALPIVYLVLRAIGADESVIRTLLRPRTVELLATSLLLAAGTAGGALLLGVPLAWLTTRTDLPGRRVWAVLTVAPLAVPSYLLAYALVAATGPRGILPEAAEALDIGWVPSPFGVPGALIVLVLSTYPLVLLAARAAFVRVDPAVEEQARSLGDGPGRAFGRATLPMITPAIATGALLAGLYAISDFGAVSILRTDTFARAIHIQYRSSLDRHGAAMFSLVLVGAALLLVLVEARVRRRAGLTMPHGSRRPAPMVRLRGWRWSAVLLCALTVFLGLVLPAATVVLWLVRGVGQEGVLVDVVGPAQASLVTATGAALVATLLALPVAWMRVRYPGRLVRVAQAVMYSAYAIPGICFALAMVFVSLALVPDLYRSLPVLVVASSIRFLPLASAPMTGSLSLIGPGMSEAARSLGASPARVAATIVLPLARPGIMAGGALVFLTVIKELPLTLLVAPPGFRTLATRVWNDSVEGFYARAAAPALVLLLVSLLSIAFLVRGRDTSSS